MTNLVIPKRQVPALKAVASATATQVEALVAAFQESPPKVLASEYIAEVLPRVSDDIRPLVAPFVLTVISLYSVKSRQEMETVEFAWAIGSAAIEPGGEELSAKDREILTDRLVQLLDLKGSITVTAKASSMYNDYPHTYCNARVLTDIRPIFESDTSVKPSASFVLHSLKLGFHTAGRYEEVFVALNNADVLILRNMLNRSLEKASTLQSLLKSEGIVYLEEGDK